MTAVEKPAPLRPSATRGRYPPSSAERLALKSPPAPAQTARADAARADAARADAARFATEFSAWYTQECPRVFGYLLRRTGDAFAAEDLTAEVFLLAWKTNDGGVPRPGWTFVTARNLLANQRRADARLVNLYQELGSEIRTGTAPGFGPPPDDDDPQMRLFIAAVDKLSAAQRELLMARYWDELSTAECARLFDCSLAAVKVRLHRLRLAVAKLCRELSPTIEETR